MGTVKLNVWISEIDDPCKISNRTWYVNIFNCDGKPLEWCGKKFVVLPAKCGHLEVEIPPGCYTINAVWGFRFAGGLYYVNHLTDHAIVQACCGQDHCVTLYTPSAHRCGIIYLRAVKDLQTQKVVKPELVRHIEKAVLEVNKAMEAKSKEKLNDKFELGLEDFKKLVMQKERTKRPR